MKARMDARLNENNTDNQQLIMKDAELASNKIKVKLENEENLK